MVTHRRGRGDVFRCDVAVGLRKGETNRFVWRYDDALIPTHTLPTTTSQAMTDSTILHTYDAAPHRTHIYVFRVVQELEDFVGVCVATWQAMTGGEHHETTLRHSQTKIIAQGFFDGGMEWELSRKKPRNDRNEIIIASKNTSIASPCWVCVWKARVQCEMKGPRQSIGRNHSGKNQYRCTG